MKDTKLRQLWEEIYGLRLRILELEGMVVHRNAGAAKEHEDYLRSHILSLPDGIRKEAALMAFDNVALKTDMASDLLICARSVK